MTIAAVTGPMPVLSTRAGDRWSSSVVAVRF